MNFAVAVHRRSWWIALILAVVTAACSTGTVDRQLPSLSARVDDASAPATTPGETSATSRGSTTSTAAKTGSTAAQPSALPSAEATVQRARPGAVELPDGARLEVRETSVTSTSAVLSLRQVGPATYEPKIEGTWTPPARLRLPLPAINAQGWGFVLLAEGTGWAVEAVDFDPDAFVEADVDRLGRARALSCAGPGAEGPNHVLNCLANGQVVKLPADLGARIAAELGCAQSWPASPLLAQSDYCPNGPSQPTTTPSSPSTATTRSASSTAPPATAHQALQVALFENPVLCNGEVRDFGVVSNAAPGETLVFSSAQTSSLSPGTADGSGQKTIRWVCEPSAGGAQWTVTVTGSTSGRTATFSFVGKAPAPATTQPPPPPAAPKLAVSLFENPVACTGQRRPFGTISGAGAGEIVGFQESTYGPLLSGTADASGNLTINWQCDAGEFGPWTVTATGQSTGRSVTFSFSGS
ncbi:MAG: hypothetical protein OEY23_06500 [Acidimicrobiia bacterium]|nr:hypothetical protein [Acidimicrobiia bacterium]